MDDDQETGQAPVAETDQSNEEAVESVADDLQKQFDELTDRKKVLWATLVGRLSHEDIYYNYAHEKEPEWEEIRKLDAELLQLDAQIKGGR